MMKDEKKRRKPGEIHKAILFYVGVAAVVAGIAMIYIPAAVIVGGLFIAGTAIS